MNMSAWVTSDRFESAIVVVDQQTHQLPLSYVTSSNSAVAKMTIATNSANIVWHRRPKFHRLFMQNNEWTWKMYPTTVYQHVDPGLDSYKSVL